MLASISSDFGRNGFWFMNGNGKILVGENETPTAMMIVSLLTQIGFDVQVAAKGEKGLAIAQERKFDLILLDTYLPDISGLKICAELKQRHLSYRTPVIFLSDQHGEQYHEQALELGAVDYILKPFEPTDFIFRIKSHTSPKNNFAPVPASEVSAR
jgi:DNA-binding response OmpR family regulator